jgi:hypothetical protein
MNQLTLKAIFDIALQLLEQGEDLEQYPIYLGNDDELNGIHNGWYVNILDVKDENCTDFIELIEEDCCTTDLKDKGILIS